MSGEEMKLLFEIVTRHDARLRRIEISLGGLYAVIVAAAWFFKG